MQFEDFKQLKALKKELETAEKGGQAAEPVVQQRRNRTIKLRSIEEEHSRNEGFFKGQAVRMMDTNDEATITGFRKDCFELTFPDGLVITAVKGEFIVIDKEEDRMMFRSMPSAPKKKDQRLSAGSAFPGGQNEPLRVDLHLERIPGNESIPEWAALDFQLDYFRRKIRENAKHRGKKIVFIHGGGDGVLKSALRKELDEVFALTCSYQAGTSDNHGPDTTIVTIR
jgi:hypothetical protein